MTPLCETFRLLSRWTWDVLGKASTTGLSFGEESVTDYLLVQLAHRHPRDVIVTKFTRHQESQNGSDWEWWFTEAGAWWGMRVQAKVLDPATSRFASLNYKPRGKPRQYQTLLAASAAAGIFPAYSFYGAWSPAPPTSSTMTPHCPIPLHEPNIMGCCLASAADVARVLLSRNTAKDRLADVLPLSLPWACLVCCPGQRGSLPARVRAAVEPLASDDAALPDLRSEPPAHVARILRGEADGISEVIMNDGAQGFPVPNGVVIVRGSPD